ncbi:MAG: transcription termination factor Rho [Gemmatimonadota bacterium]|nr:MAG: transcription termination factor Rho [Gemmatimonadota bacterium]
MKDSKALGVLELINSGGGFLRSRGASYVPSGRDVHVGRKMVQRYRLRSGDEIAGEVGESPGRGKSPPLTRITAINGRPPEEIEGRPDFDRLGAVHPDEQLVLECGRRLLDASDYTNRVIDLLCPFGRGQRALIVSPAKAGKTTVLQSVAEGIVKNYPEATLLILLVDERPEEVTEMEACGFGEVVSSSFDFPADRHVAVAELTLERARRRVELGEDVIIILDSITRLARAYNNVERGTGRTLSGGLDASSLEKPKRFLGSARKIDPAKGGGSLTIIATALVDTGSRMDDVIFEEFKGTGNSELVLSRELADRRIFPAIDLNASGTRREELLLSPQALGVSQAIRRRLAQTSPVEAMTELLGVMKRTASNADLVSQAARPL